MKSYLLLTGATGFIGQYVLRRLLVRDVPVVVIARGSNSQTANDRVQSIVRNFEIQEGTELAKPIVFTGSLHDEMLGLDDFALEWFQEHCKSVLHNAASIRFHAPGGDRNKDPWLSNLAGTRNLLEVCRVAGIDEFHHVSTAYVSGVRTDTCYESELDVGQDFVNDYQHSKAEAERLVRAADFLKSTTIYRPALVVGDSRDGFTTAPDFGLYHYIQFSQQMNSMVRADGQTGTINVPFRLRFTGKERRNIVTIDWVADAMVYLLLRPELHNKTYHLTPDRPISSSQILSSICDYFDLKGIEFVGGQEIPVEDRNEVERMFYDYVQTFEAYWEDEPTFDRENTDRALGAALPTPEIDAACMHRLIDFAVANCFT